ncbi:MAG: DegT/DnrJ/EryC1/StrS family aminotransferase [Gammaproteobacteria bacterium]|nr:DegT/DnrJ/EryC1/StrS family aminotransferase [Gammaproteobacteria bacterium]
MIPMVNLKAQFAELESELSPKLSDALQGAMFVMGPTVHAFERACEDYLGVKHAISCASGTDALHFALRALGVGEGDEVITTAFTFIATAEAIAYVGATPVFVDICKKTFNLDIACVEAAITPKTKAIMPVHLFGQPANLDALRSLCDAHDLLLIEDCAQSFGASTPLGQTGAVGHSAGYSFFPSKNLGCYGDGGLVVTQDDEVAALMRSYRNHGSDVRYYHDRIGYNSRLDELQAVILHTKLQYIDRYNARRREVAHRYSAALGEYLTTPYEDGYGMHVYHQYTLLADDRAAIQSALAEREIASAVYYPVPLHRQKAFGPSYASVSLPVTERVAESCLSLPICANISNAEVDQVIEAVISAVRKTQ